jgi:hypothetical protein
MIETGCCRVLMLNAGQESQPERRGVKRGENMEPWTELQPSGLTEIITNGPVQAGAFPSEIGHGSRATRHHSLLAPPHRLKAMIVQSQHQQMMEIYLNGRFVGLAIGKPQETDRWSFPVPKTFFEKDEANVMAFVCRNAIVPAEEGWSVDLRRLSFAFQELTLNAAF